MKDMKADDLFSISSEETFNAMALQVFQYQSAKNEVYNKYLSVLGIDGTKINKLEQIPFLPIEFFKSQEVICGSKNKNSIIFTSSTTTLQTPSKHIVSDISFYEKSFLKGFEKFYGNPKDYIILALLPGYIERGSSSLVYMFDKLIKETKNKDSGFFLNNYDELKIRIEKVKSGNKKILLIGVSYALLDLAETSIQLNENFIVMETGGMKGKRPELLKEELHAVLKQKLNVTNIHSEYGMTELLSQAYSKRNGVFECPPWMRVLIRNMDDPLSLAKPNSTGGINVIDLANFNSCSFIATQDLGKMITKTQFELMGRFDASDIRGCNLMISD